MMTLEGLSRHAMEHATQHALEEYLRAHPKADKKKHRVKPHERTTPKTTADVEAAGHTELKGIFKPSADAIDTTLKANKAHFDAVAEEVTKQAESFKSEQDPTYDNDDEIDPTDFMAQVYPRWSLAEKRLHVGGHRMGEHFEKSLSKDEKKMHDQYFDMWRTASGAFDAKGYGDPSDMVLTSQELQGLAASLGVHGSFAPDDTEVDKVTKGGVTKTRKKAAENKKLQAYAKKMYDYQQAYFKHVGIKELTLYRAVKDPSVDTAEPGTHAKVESRELSSFTADPNLAKKFGRVLQYKVPADRIFACSLVRPGIGSETCDAAIFKEAEFIVMGASDLEGQTLGKPMKRTAAQRTTLQVPISNENADWLQKSRERLRTKKAAERVLHRWLVVSDVRSSRAAPVRWCNVRRA